MTKLKLTDSRIANIRTDGDKIIAICYDGSERMIHTTDTDSDADIVGKALNKIVKGGVLKIRAYSL